jgi:hypothetical protein
MGKESRSELAERRALELIEFTAEEARKLIDESAEHALALLAAAVVEAKALIEAEHNRGGDTTDMELHVQEAQDMLEAALKAKQSDATKSTDDR